LDGINYTDAHAPSFLFSTIWATLAVAIHICFEPECRAIAVIAISVEAAATVGEV